MSIEEFQKRRDALMRWTVDKGDDNQVEAIDLAPYILTASELIDDLLTELRRMYQKDYALFERHSYDDVNDEEFHIGELLAEVKRLREENKILAKYMDIVQKYDDALLADGDTDPRWSELFD